MITSATIFTIKPTTGPTRKIFGSFCSHLRDRYISFTRELSLQGNKADAERGSSPLTRGTLNGRPRSREDFRFIPAYAGNSPSASLISSQVAVHPRLRGELMPEHYPKMLFVGSSPLTRGTHFKLCISRPIWRFIPAYAGNSFFASSFLHSSTVHPRLRGELERQNVLSNVALRFIPAYAGNSLKQGIEHLTNSSKDFLSGKYAKNPETVLNHFKNSSLD